MIARAIAAASFGHLAICYIYLFFLHLGFSGDVGVFFTATDVFSVGLRNIIPFYMFGLAIGAYCLGLYIEDPFRFKNRDTFQMHSSHVGSRALKFSNTVLYIAPILQIIYYVMGYPVTLFIIFSPIALILAWWISKAFEANDLADKWRMLTIFLSLGVYIIATQAYSEGFRNRTRGYEYFEDRPIICDSGSKVLFLVGDKLVVVRPDGVRQMVGDDCTVIGQFENKIARVDIIP